MPIKKSPGNTVKLDALFFGAHPDDVELNCGGTVLKLVESGFNTGIADITKGELSTRGNLKLRNEETRKATELLGIQVRENLGISDGNIENNETNRIKVISVLRKYKPKLVFIPYHHDRHPDHINASRLLSDSCFYSGLVKIKTGNLAPHKPERIFYYRNAYDMPVSFIFDISGTFGKKREVLKCYGSQFYHKDSSEPETFISSKLFDYEIEARARHFGFKIGVEFGEPYFCNESIKVNEKNIFEI